MRHLDQEETKSLLANLGPGLIAGASDDDPGGIGTYSQAGAQVGYSLIWVLALCYPLMAAVQQICGRIGRVTGKGLAANMLEHSARWLVYGIVALLVVANVVNLAADIAAKLPEPGGSDE